ncbi:hypothetical protein Y11_00041 [Yersinia enterocolitica subsp. palearctica Y11]|uniref:Uncharacterized protein n=1 Tax=Yersinia enterocolitica subsp. palearctica serotype O:3 (strain DSM 13030 / CIP 106945 / Y11) TaxID=930944 RepID=A0A0H3NXF5_YERE1|nr:hypothetical protein Y11_00041 [Yersinia enterocolitica subsp. palearctica Y11]CCO67158.1 hypothetical protein D322_262 [Yersinia enterocolitica IP 10393]
MSSLAALLQQQWLWGSFDLLPIKRALLRLMTSHANSTLQGEDGQKSKAFAA